MIPWIVAPFPGDPEQVFILDSYPQRLCMLAYGRAAWESDDNVLVPQALIQSVCRMQGSGNRIIRPYVASIRAPVNL